MPTPVNLIQKQQQLRRLGKIRMGDKVEGEKNGKTYTRPSAIDTWRFTSPDKALLEIVAKKYGGSVEKWNDDWEVITDAKEVYVRLWPIEEQMQYEFWSGGGRLRSCDGITCCKLVMIGDEPSTEDVPCFCDSLPDKEKCKLRMRFAFELAGIGVPGLWIFETGSQYAAREMPAMYDAFLEQGGNGCLAILGIEQKSEVKAGLTKNFNVPYLTARPGMQQDYLKLDPVDMRAVLAMPRQMAPALESGAHVHANPDTGEVIEAVSAEVIDAPDPFKDKAGGKPEGVARQAALVPDGVELTDEEFAQLKAEYGFTAASGAKVADWTDIPSFDELKGVLESLKSKVPSLTNLNNVMVASGGSFADFRAKVDSLPGAA